MSPWKLLVGAAVLAAIYFVIDRIPAESIPLTPKTQTSVCLLVSLSGMVVFLLAMFWKREGSIAERIVDSLWSMDDARDRRPRAWWLLLGFGLVVLGLYMVIQIWVA
jgi:hypothetical protein